MSRRTFPRAAAAGLVAAALGAPSPAAAQAPNPWRGETAALPAAPAPHAGQVVLGLRYNALGGLTGSIQVRSAAAVPVAPAPRAVAPPRPVCVDLDVVAGPCPCPTQLTAQGNAAPTVVEITYRVGPAMTSALKALVAGTADVPATGDDERNSVEATAPPIPPAGLVTPAGYTAPVIVAPLRFMPLPAQLPAPRVIPPIPPAEGLVPLQIEGTFPEKGTRPVRTPGSNAVPHGQPQLLETVLPAATPSTPSRQ